VELPWLKDSLEKFTCGVAWEDRELLHPDYPTWVADDEARVQRRRRHLRAV